jgi:DNA-binding GntR family transcriptional regulator
MSDPSLVFISHDSRDADIAEAFDDLLTDVSGGTLESFRASDRKGTHGIEYGKEWYRVIIEKLDEATDVVALLTANSINRPWVFYEMGVAKGKRPQHPVFGVALGVTISKAATGPFKQFQNSADTEDAITRLVLQLMRRHHQAGPRPETVRSQVTTFRKSVAVILKNRNRSQPHPQSGSQEAAVCLVHLSFPPNCQSHIVEHANALCEEALKGVKQAIMESVPPKGLDYIGPVIRSRPSDDTMVVWRLPSGGDAAARQMVLALRVVDFVGRFQAVLFKKFEMAPVVWPDLRKVKVAIGLSFGDAPKHRSKLDGSADFMEELIKEAEHLLPMAEGQGLAVDLRLAPHVFMERVCSGEGELSLESFKPAPIPVWVTRNFVRSRTSRQESRRKIATALKWLRAPYKTQSNPDAFEISLTEDDMNSVFDIRMFWERKFAEDLAGRIRGRKLPKRDLNPIELTIRNMNKIIKGQGRIAGKDGIAGEKWKKLGAAFHEHIAKLSHHSEGRQRAQFTRLICNFTKPVYEYAIVGRLDARAVVTEHQKIFGCIRYGNIPAAGNAAEQHVRNHYERASEGVLGTGRTPGSGTHD